MDRFNELTVFVRVAETNSFTKAATSLGLSRATVSVAIQQLEQRLGARLLHRTTRRVSLTHEGERYHASASEVLAKLEAAEQIFQGGQRGVTGKISLDVPTRIASRVIIPALPELLALHPRLEIKLGASDRTVDLVEKGIDAVVRVGALQDSTLVARQVGALTLVNCASPAYLARHGHPVDPKDLDRHVVVAYSARVAGGGLWRYVARGQQHARPVRSVVEVDNAEAYVASCLAGLGMIQVPAYDVSEHLESGALVAVMQRHVAPPLPLSLVYPGRRMLPVRIRAVGTWLTEVFTRHGMFAPSAFVTKRATR